MSSKLREDFEGGILQGLNFIQSSSLNDFCLVLTIDGNEYTVLLPEEYPNGEISIIGASCHTTAGGNLRVVADAVYNFHMSVVGDSDSTSEGMSSQQTTGSMMIEGSTAFGFDTSFQDDVEACNKYFGFNTATSRRLETSEWVTLNMSVKSIIDEATAMAWGVRTDIPIEITIKFNSKAYIESGARPLCEFRQKGEKFLLGQQLSRILDIYLTLHFITMHVYKKF